MSVDFLRSKTFWGSVAAAAGYLLAAPHIGVAEILQAVGGVVGIKGLRDAILRG